MAVKKLLVSDLIGKSIKALVKERNDLRQKLYDLKLKNSLRALNKTHEITVTRRNIARVNTAISQKTQETKQNS